MPTLESLGSQRKLERLFENCDFSAIDREIESQQTLMLDNPDFSSYSRDKDTGEDDAGPSARDAFRQTSFTDSPVIVCRMTYDTVDAQGRPLTETEMARQLDDKGLMSLEARDTDYYELLPEVYNVAMWLAGIMKAEQVGRVMVARLNPGGHVKSHKDYGDYHDFYDRFHICVGGEGCYFRCDRETVKMLPGEVWWFRNNCEHEVHNDSPAPRDHVIVDLKLKGDKNVFRTGGDTAAVPGSRPHGRNPSRPLAGSGAGSGQDPAQTPV